MSRLAEQQLKAANNVHITQLGLRRSVRETTCIQAYAERENLTHGSNTNIP